jgi:hypothetical protein
MPFPHAQHDHNDAHATAGSCSTITRWSTDDRCAKACSAFVVAAPRSAEPGALSQRTLQRSNAIREQVAYVVANCLEPKADGVLRAGRGVVQRRQSSSETRLGRQPAHCTHALQQCQVLRSPGWKPVPAPH